MIDLLMMASGKISHAPFGLSFPINAKQPNSLTTFINNYHSIFKRFIARLPCVNPVQYFFLCYIIKSGYLIIPLYGKLNIMRLKNENYHI